MLYKLSLKNIKKSIKDYAIYFFTLILGVSIFYIFNALESQTVMMQVSSNTKDIIKLMNNILSGVSVFVSFILGFLIIYASRFLIKRRKKEFGIYLTLGMSKQKISKILLLETLFIGLISLLIGLTLGTFLSQFMSLLVANMFEADLTEFAFIFSKSAAIKTLIYFSIIFIIVMIFNTINISKCKLIDLIHGFKKNETIKLKNPLFCTIIFIISVIILGIAYYLVTAGIQLLSEASYIFIPILMGIIGTLLLFFSISGLLIRVFTKLKNIYYKGLNSFIIKQISSKINTTVISMSIISIMLFVTICVLSSAISLKNSMTANLTTLVPVDIEIKKERVYNKEDYLNSGHSIEEYEDTQLGIKESLEKLDYNVDKNLKDIFEYDIYRTEEITVEKTLGDYYLKALEGYPYLAYKTGETLIKLSDYNTLAKRYGFEELTLKKHEYVLVSNFDSWSLIRDEALKLNTTIKLNGKEYKPKYNVHKDGFIHISSNHTNEGIFVLPDEALENLLAYKSILIADYNGDTKEEKKEIENFLLKLNNHPYLEYTTIDVVTKISIYEASTGLGAMATFIGLYLGIIFLISSAAILALKELTESSDNKERYKMLRKIGADEKLIKKALFKQIGIFFTFPLLIAIIHSIFGIIFCNYILETFGNEKLLISIIMTAAVLIFIYGGYFLITYLCSKNIIKD